MERTHWHGPYCEDGMAEARAELAAEHGASDSPTAWGEQEHSDGSRFNASPAVHAEYEALRLASGRSAPGECRKVGTMDIPDPRQTVRVRVVLAVDVDRDAWNETYGESESASDIRYAVRSAVVTAASTDGIIAPAGVIIGASVEGLE